LAVQSTNDLLRIDGGGAGRRASSVQQKNDVEAGINPFMSSQTTIALRPPGGPHGAHRIS
jgi:hypothetical protein